MSATHPLTLDALDAQERRFARAYAAGDISSARDLYQPDVVYLSPTTRLYEWPRRIEGRARTLEFIQLTLAGLERISYSVEERALVPGAGAYVLVEFDFGLQGARLRSTYVVVYRYRAGLISRQELYYDPDDRFDHV